MEAQANGLLCYKNEARLGMHVAFERVRRKTSPARIVTYVLL